MKVEGSSDIPAPRDKVWAAFLDPATLAKAIPGCEGLDEIGPGEYKAKMKIGVAASPNSTMRSRSSRTRGKGASGRRGSSLLESPLWPPASQGSS